MEWSVYRDRSSHGLVPEHLGFIQCEEGTELREVAHRAWRRFGGFWPFDQMIIR